METWDKELGRRGLNPRTVEAYPGWLRRFSLWLGAARVTDAQEYVSQLVRERKPATAQAAADALRAWSRDHGQGWSLRTPPREAITAPKSLGRQPLRRRPGGLADGGLAGERGAPAPAPADMVLRERSDHVMVLVTARVDRSAWRAGTPRAVVRHKAKETDACLRGIPIMIRLIRTLRVRPTVGRGTLDPQIVVRVHGPEPSGKGAGATHGGTKA